MKRSTGQPEFLLQPRDADGPVFNAPWEAQAFGLVLALHAQDLFSWDEWASALHAAIAAAQQQGDPDLGDTYYEHWLAALEALLLQKGIASSVDLKRRKAQWHAAYANTPHGQPVELTASHQA